MPIEVGHAVNPALQAQLSFKAGQGQYNQWKQKFEAQAQQQSIDNAFRMSGELRAINQPFQQAQLQQWGQEQRADLEIRKTRAIIDHERQPEQIAAAVQYKKNVIEEQTKVGAKMMSSDLAKLQQNLKFGEKMETPHNGSYIVGTNENGILSGKDAATARDRIYNRVKSIDAHSIDPAQSVPAKLHAYGNDYVQAFDPQGKPIGPPMLTKKAQQIAAAEKVVGSSYEKQTVAYETGVAKQITDGGKIIDDLATQHSWDVERVLKEKGKMVASVRKANEPYRPDYGEMMDRYTDSKGMDRMPGRPSKEASARKAAEEKTAAESVQATTGPGGDGWRAATRPVNTTPKIGEGAGHGAVATRAADSAKLNSMGAKKTQTFSERLDDPKSLIGLPEGESSSLKKPLKTLGDAQALSAKLNEWVAKNAKSLSASSPVARTQIALNTLINKWEKALAPFEASLVAGKLTYESAERAGMRAQGFKGEVGGLMAKEAISWEEALNKTLSPMVDAGLMAQHELEAGDREKLLPVLSRFTGVTSSRGTHRLTPEDVYHGWAGQKEGDVFDVGSLDAVGENKDLVLNTWFSLANKRNWQEKSEFFSVGTGLPGPSRHERNPFIKPEETLAGGVSDWIEDAVGSRWMGGKREREEYGSKFDISAPPGETSQLKRAIKAGGMPKAVAGLHGGLTGTMNWMWEFIGGSP